MPSDYTGDLTNTVVTSSATADPNPGCATCSDTNFESGFVDLAVFKSVDIETPSVNEEISFVVLVKNNGPSMATQISINESLPSGYSYVSHQESMGSYDGFSTWSIPALMDGDAAELKIKVVVNDSGNYASVTNIISLDQRDIDESNDVAAVTTTPVCLSIFNEFSPNNDGVNDVFRIDCVSQYPNNTLKIFNRSGTLVYSKKGYDNTWNGTANARVTINTSKKLPSGTYYYVFDIGDGSKPKTGWLYINW